MANSLVLTIKTSPSIILAQDASKTDNITLGDTEYLMVLQSIGFTKKMYEPGVINAVIQFKVSKGDWKTIGKSLLDTTFKNKEVVLNYGVAKKGADDKWTVSGKTVCSSYYVHELHPQYTSDSLFVTMVIYSVDKQLTLTEKCRSWTRQRLCRDIIDNQASNYKLPYSNTNIKYDYTNLTIISTTSNHKEAIFPYLVQYNESYYDFLVRTCNRWGQFLYFENGKVTIGYKSTKKGTVTHETNDNNYTYDHYTFCNLNGKSTTPVSAEDFADGTTYDAHILNNILKKDGYDEIRGVIGCDKDHGGDVWGAKIVGDLLSSGKNVYDYLVDMLVDSGIAWGQVNKRVNDNNKQFNKDYFTVGSSDVKKAHYDSASSPTEYNEFAEHTPILSSATYKAVVKGELAAATDAVCIDFNTSYQDIKLGDVISLDDDSQEYIVVQVNSKDNKKLVLDVNAAKEDEKIKTKTTTVFQVIATKKDADGKNFYPTLHPNGHVRKCEALRGKIAKASADDPTKQGRVQVHFNWQPDGEDTPWLEYMHPGGKSTGTYHKHYVDEEVIVAFADGNMERPYVLGSVSDDTQTAPGSTVANNIVHVTPGGQAIKMTDGTGAGATAFTAGLMPSFKMVQGFYPGVVTAGMDTDDTMSFEGNIELTDKFGIYSIKGSTDGRNISIKSPFGDIKLNAFTGITISAPNGDVKIQGKNVSIEAGNNLTLTSGKNIKDGFWCTYHDKSLSKGVDFIATVGDAAFKKIASMLGGFIDFTMIRNIVEVFMRPVEGKLTVKSNRNLALEAGTGKTAYPMDAFQYANWVNLVYDARVHFYADNKSNSDRFIKEQFSKVNTWRTNVIPTFCNMYQTAHGMIGAVNQFINDYSIPGPPGGKPTLSCKSLEEMLDGIWGDRKTAIDAAFMGFKELLADAADFNAMTPGMKAVFKTYQAYDDARRAGITAVENLRLAVESMKNFQIKPFITAQHFDAAVQTELETKLKDSMINKCTTDTDIKYFRLDNLDSIRVRGEKPLKRAAFIVLVNHFRIEREKMGGINGVGAKVPDEPQPFDNEDDVAWNNYVNSIQKLPTVPHKYNPADYFQKNLGDPLAKQFGLADLYIDAVDNFAFGANSKGKILFTSDKETMELGKEIIRVNTDSAEDYEYDEHKTESGFVAEIRRAMNS